MRTRCAWEQTLAHTATHHLLDVDVYDDTIGCQSLALNVQRNTPSVTLSERRPIQHLHQSALPSMPKQEGMPQPETLTRRHYEQSLRAFALEQLRVTRAWAWDTA